jgi:hypothetical protein
MMRRLLLVLLAGSALLSGCATVPPGASYEKLVAANPRSILIVPVANKSVDVDAPAYFLSTLPVPVAERGYYVFPVNAVKRVLEDDGLSDAFLVHQADPMRLASLFGADAVLYVTIERWDAQYMLISTSVTVEFDYVMKDGKTGDTIWTNHQKMTYAPSSGGGGGGLGAIIAAVVSAALEKASPSYMPLARQANDAAVEFPGPGFPAGPYRAEYRRDLAPAPGAKPER